MFRSRKKRKSCKLYKFHPRAYVQFYALTCFIARLQDVLVSRHTRSSPGGISLSFSFSFSWRRYDFWDLRILYSDWNGAFGGEKPIGGVDPEFGRRIVIGRRLEYALWVVGVARRVPRDGQPVSWKRAARCDRPTLMIPYRASYSCTYVYVATHARDLRETFEDRRSPIHPHPGLIPGEFSIVFKCAHLRRSEDALSIWERKREREWERERKGREGSAKWRTVTKINRRKTSPPPSPLS